jgi:hypothetical protein
MKLNCWEFKKCGRESIGGNQLEGVCPAALERALNGVHNGKNGGRACWVVAGTLCNGEVQGTFAKKYSNCEQCDFFNKVWQEETTGYVYSSTLLRKLSASSDV